MKCSDHFYVCIKDLFPVTFSSICRNSEKICSFLFPLSYFNEQSINRYTLSMLKLAILINYSFTTRSLIPPKLKISAVIQRYHYALNYIAWVYSSFENIALHQQCNRYSVIITWTILKHRRRVTTLYMHYKSDRYLCPNFFPFTIALLRVLYTPEYNLCTYRCDLCLREI